MSSHGGIAAITFPFNWDPQRVGTQRMASKHPTYTPYQFPFNWDPQRVGTHAELSALDGTIRVSIQLGSPASGDWPSDTHTAPTRWFPFNWDPQRVGTLSCSEYQPDRMTKVSIQLGSPASGDSTPNLVRRILKMRRCFHSIGIPSEWGPIFAKSIGYSNSVRFPFNWDPQRVGTIRGRMKLTIDAKVSIQLGSPASGDYIRIYL